MTNPKYTYEVIIIDRVLCQKVPALASVPVWKDYYGSGADQAEFPVPTCPTTPCTLLGNRNRVFDPIRNSYKETNYFYCLVILIPCHTFLQRHPIEIKFFTAWSIDKYARLQNIYHILVARLFCIHCVPGTQCCLQYQYLTFSILQFEWSGAVLWTCHIL